VKDCCNYNICNIVSLLPSIQRHHVMYIPRYKVIKNLMQNGTSHSKETQFQLLSVLT